MTDTLTAAFSRDPATADELRAVLAAMNADGLVLVHRDDLAGLVAACLHAGADAVRVAVQVLLASDLDALAEAVVRAGWREWRGDESHDGCSSPTTKGPS